MVSSTKGILFLATSAVCFGLMPIFAELSYQAGVKVNELLFLRFLMAFVVMGIILLAFHRFTLPSKKDMVLLFVLGSLGYFLQSTFYFTALLYSPVPIVSLVLYTYPAFVTIGSHLLGWEGITWRVAASVAIAIVGLILVANPFGSSWGPGVALAFLASITYTTYILANTNVLKRITGDLASFFVMGAACLTFGLAAFGTRSLAFDWQPVGWVWISMLALFSTVVAVNAFFLGLSLIGPSRSSLISLLEPLTSVAFSFMILAETLSAMQAIGGLLILVSSIGAATSGSVAPHKR